jgi:hypothetical protein
VAGPNECFPLAVASSRCVAGAFHGYYASELHTSLPPLTGAPGAAHRRRPGGGGQPRLCSHRQQGAGGAGGTLRAPCFKLPSAASHLLTPPGHVSRHSARRGPLLCKASAAEAGAAGVPPSRSLRTCTDPDARPLSLRDSGRTTRRDLQGRPRHIYTEATKGTRRASATTGVRCIRGTCRMRPCYVPTYRSRTGGGTLGLEHFASQTTFNACRQAGRRRTVAPTVCEGCASGVLSGGVVRT